MLNTLINCLIFLGVIVTICLISAVFCFIAMIILSAILKIVEAFKDDGNKKS